ncbi:hypothetical protein GCM10023223_39430 [Stackebrandtia albiflava]
MIRWSRSGTCNTWHVNSNAPTTGCTTRFTVPRRVSTSCPAQISRNCGLDADRSATNPRTPGSSGYRAHAARRSATQDRANRRCSGSANRSAAPSPNITRSTFAGPQQPAGAPAVNARAAAFIRSTSYFASTTYAGTSTIAASRSTTPAGTSRFTAARGRGVSPVRWNRCDRSSWFSINARANAFNTCRDGRGPRACSSRV